jgi:hypothetical protein
VHHLPIFLTAPGQTDVLMVVTALILLFSVVAFGVLFFRLHSLPEQVAHRSHKVQMEIVSILCLISLFTHEHIFWIAGLILAFIDIPDFGSPLRRITGAVEKMAGVEPPPDATAEASHEAVADGAHRAHGGDPAEEARAAKAGDGVTAMPKKPAAAATQKERSHA